MMLRSIHIIKCFAVIALTISGMASCITDKFPDDALPVVVDEKVVLPLDIKGAGYDLPFTRTGVAKEDDLNDAPWIIVYKGSGSTAVFAEVVRAYVSDNKWYVNLSKQTEACQLYILANPPANVGYGNLGWQPALTLGHIENYYGTDKTINTLCNMMRTTSLGAVTNHGGGVYTYEPTISYVPYTRATDYLPMVCVSPQPNITSATNLTVKLKRIVAKIVIDNTADDFELLGATVVKAPNRGYFHRYDNAAYTNLEKVDYIGSGTDPVVSIGEARAPAPASLKYGTVLQTTEENPLYVYDVPAAHNSMSVIVKALYNNKPYYYKMALTGTSGDKLDIRMNYEYTFTITSATRRGFDTFEEACNAPNDSNALLLSLTVAEQDAHDIIDNGKYYMGLTNSEVRVYNTGAIGGSGIHALTVYTNAMSFSNVVTSVSVSNELVLIQPSSGTITTSATNIMIGVKGNPTTVASGTITIRIGDLEKVIPVSRMASLTRSAQALKFPAAGDTRKYVSAHSEGADNWIRFLDRNYDPASDGTHGEFFDKLHSRIYTAAPAGEIWMHIPATTSARVAYAYLSPLNSTQGRIKIYIQQLY